jgi:tripartite-type tricarboxylate transporter receptor subunit TctC
MLRAGDPIGERIGKALLPSMSFLCLWMAFAAAAQKFPDKPVRLIVPFPAGGPLDNVVRPFAPRLAEALGQPVIVDNRPGAGGAIGANIVAKAPADGYTLLWGSAGPVAINVSLYRNTPYDPVKDFAPVTQTVATQIILVLNAALPPQSVKELIAYAKARPGQINYASPGNGTSPHLAMELFKHMAGIDLLHVPYKGGPLAMTDLLAGRAALMFIALSSALPHVHTGKLKALAVATPKRAAAMPDLPTMSEAGVPGYDASSWHGVLAPAGTPKAVIAHLNGVLLQVLRNPDVRAAMLLQGAEAAGSTPEQFGTYIRAEIAKWANVIKVSGTTVD